MDSDLDAFTQNTVRHVPRVAPPNVLPAVCDVSVTNVCNAACDFCGFSRDKMTAPRRYIDLSEFIRALPILKARRIRYMTFQGGEPLVHPNINSLVAEAANAGMVIGIITNGWFLTRHIEAMAEGGLRRVTISIDSSDPEKHDANRGLDGLCERIKEGTARTRALGIPIWASVTVNRLVDYDALPATLQKLGFEAVCFSFPRRKRCGSTSLVFDEQSTLINFEAAELIAALEAIDRMRSKFPVLNPTAAVAEVERFVRGEEQRVPCVGGRKYFYLDWNLDIWRCEAWSEPMGSVFELDAIPDQREPCFDCMMACYRDASAVMHGALAVTDAVGALAHGKLREASNALRRPGVTFSLGALAAAEILRLAPLPKFRAGA